MGHQPIKLANFYKKKHENEKDELGDCATLAVSLGFANGYKTYGWEIRLKKTSSGNEQQPSPDHLKKRKLRYF